VGVLDVYQFPSPKLRLKYFFLNLGCMKHKVQLHISGCTADVMLQHSALLILQRRALFSHLVRVLPSRHTQGS